MCTNVKKGDIISEGEYRSLLDDHLSSSGQIRQRVGYLEVFLRDVIRKEIGAYKKSENK